MSQANAADQLEVVATSGKIQNVAMPISNPPFKEVKRRAMAGRLPSQTPRKVKINADHNTSASIAHLIMLYLYRHDEGG